MSVTPRLHLNSSARATLIAFAALGFATAVSAATTTILSNSMGGDNYTNGLGTNQGQAIGATGWVYNNVRNSGEVGISSDYARSGAGSVRFEGVFGPGGASSKADLELLGTPVNVGGNYYASTSLGLFKDLTSLSYEWYRDSVSLNSAGQHAVIRILLDADGNLGTTGDRGGLVFERAYNGGGAVPVDTWITEDIFGYNSGLGANLWTFGLGVPNEKHGYGVKLSNWQTALQVSQGPNPATLDLRNAAVLGFSSGIGSGWGPHTGAVDNISFGFNGGSTTYNFEPQQPPSVPDSASTLVLLGLPWLLLMRVRRGQRS